MRDSINNVSERGARLDSLQDKTDNLAIAAQGFGRGANRVRKQMRWKDTKMRPLPCLSWTSSWTCSVLFVGYRA